VLEFLFPKEIIKLACLAIGILNFREQISVNQVLQTIEFWMQ
jgi:hypothetical protein